MKKDKLGKILLGIGAAIAFVGSQRFTFGVKGVYLAGVVTPQLIPLRVVVYLVNKTIGKLMVRSISGELVCEGQRVATINQKVNKRISSGRYIEQGLLVDIHIQESLQALFSNIQSGDITSLSFVFEGKIYVGEQYPVGIRFKKLFTWKDIQKMV